MTWKVDHVKEAAVARCDLNALYSVIAVLEAGVISSECHATTSKIIKMCKAEADKCLTRYDGHRALAKGGHDDADA